MEDGTPKIKLPTHKRFNNLTNRVFGRLTVIAYAGQLGHSQGWLCRCACGNTKIVRDHGLTRGTTTSCGCYASECVVKRNFRHGRRFTATYSIWWMMLQRCKLPSNKAYKYYGGRGIRVCDRWQSFENFLADMGERPSPNHSIDRVNVDGDYEPSNCRWATKLEQARNCRSNRKVTFNGETKCMSEWESIFGFGTDTIGSRLRAGWSVARALTTPTKSSTLKAQLLTVPSSTKS